MFRRRRVPEQPVHSISTLPVSLAEDQETRLRAYLISMGIRTACFILSAVAYAVLESLPLALLLSVAAIVLPYPAVVLANNSGNRRAQEIRRPSPTREITGPEVNPR